MATTGSRGIQELADGLVRATKTLVNADLRKILKDEGQTVSGNKAQLQQKIEQRITYYRDTQNWTSLTRLQYRIANHGDAPPTDLTSAMISMNHHNFGAQRPVHNMPNGTNGANGYGHYNNAPSRSVSHGSRSQFKTSPFYDVLHEVTDRPLTLEISPSHRQTAKGNLTLSNESCLALRNDPNQRLYLFSALNEALTPYSTQADITFPSQVEVKVNGEEVKANYKGLKNKPGTTRPVDITTFVRRQTPHYLNRLEVTYALTQKKYTVHVYLVKKHSVEELTQRIKQRSLITKQTVINEMLRKANDPDIIFGSTVMSLKDPISTLRIATPCRSNLCNHNQCFDAESFLQLQEQAPTWTCPVCNKTVSYQGLAVDQYVQEILDTVPRSTEQVTIEPNGNWMQGNRNENQTSRNSTSNQPDPGSDDDLIEIPDYRVTNIKSEASLNTPQSLTKTPPLSSRETSTAPRTGSKRTSEVIDLTLSDDDEPPRPAKKVAYSTPNSLPDPRNHHYHRPTTFENHSQPRSLPYSPAPHQNSTSSGLRLDLRPPSQYGEYRQAPRPSYPGSVPGSGYRNYGHAP